jgi:4'-phosphopantetheinyl transferase
VTLGARCGIDIEKVRPNVENLAIAERFFSANETEWLRSRSSDQRALGFFRLWSVKESILKADGKGMTIPLSSIDALNVLDRISPRVSLPDNGCDLSLWVGELHLAEGYTSALAVESRDPRIRILRVDA